MGGCSRGAGEKGVCQLLTRGGRVSCNPSCFTPVDEQRLVVTAELADVDSKYWAWIQPADEQRLAGEFKTRLWRGQRLSAYQCSC